MCEGCWGYDYNADGKVGAKVQWHISTPADTSAAFAFIDERYLIRQSRVAMKETVVLDFLTLTAITWDTHAVIEDDGQNREVVQFSDRL